MTLSEFLTFAGWGALCSIIGFCVGGIYYLNKIKKILERDYDE